MTLMRRNPYDPFYNMDQTMDRMLDRMRSMMSTMAVPFDGDLVQQQDANPLAVDMASDDKNVIIRTALPGFKEDEVKIDVRGNVLTIAAETKQDHEDQQANWYIRELHYGKFERSLLICPR